MIKRIPIHPTHGLPCRKRRMFLLALAFAPVYILGMSWVIVGTVFAQSGNPPKQTPKKTQVQTDVQLLEGRWIRPDGGYVLQLDEIKKDGSLKASYFNPRPIKVFSSKWSRKEGEINLFVELRDINYPGSKYNLQYDPKTDRLIGTYFQAVEKQTFNIEFVRAK
ncbi:MAG TPA: hypothetical protein VMV04_14115 [Thermodesulfobacteriota bacterium]|nr:hypothetical protein [Thermodesulfobacteriota bacterium]